MRKAVLFSILLSFAITGLIGCGEESKEVVKKGGAGPLILSSVPKNGTKDLPTTTAILMTFDKDIVTPSIANLTFTPGVSGTISYNPDTRTMVFKPSAALSEHTSYTLTIKGITDLEGNTMSPVTIKFTTSVADTTSPKITFTSPEDGQEDVGHDAKILIRFSEPIDRDRLRSGISFDPTVNIPLDEFRLEWSSGGEEEVAISPPLGVEPFSVNQEYSMLLSGDSVIDLSGNHMITDYKLQFHTLRYPVEKIKNPNIPDLNMEPQWMYTLGKSGTSWVVIWGGTPPRGAPSQSGPNGTITASADGQILDKVDTLNTRGGDEFKPTVTSGNGNTLSYRTADLDNQKKFRIIFSSTSSYITLDLRSSSGTLSPQYVYIGSDLVHPSRTPFTIKNK